MNCISLIVPAGRNDLLCSLLDVAAQRGAVVQVESVGRAARLVKIELDAEGERAARRVMMGKQPIARDTSVPSANG